MWDINKEYLLKIGKVIAFCNGIIYYWTPCSWKIIETKAKLNNEQNRWIQQECALLGNRTAQILIFSFLHSYTQLIFSFLHFYKAKIYSNLLSYIDNRGIQIVSLVHVCACMMSSISAYFLQVTVTQWHLTLPYSVKTSLFVCKQINWN